MNRLISSSWNTRRRGIWRSGWRRAGAWRRFRWRSGWRLSSGWRGRWRAGGWERDVADELLREDIAACVDVDPARRFASAEELARRLETLPARRVQRVAQIEAARAAQRRLRRRRLARSALAGAALLL